MYTPNVRHEQTIGVYFFMVKFTREEKVKIVRRLDKHDGVKRFVKSIKVHPRVKLKDIKQCGISNTVYSAKYIWIDAVIHSNLCNNLM